MRGKRSIGTIGIMVTDSKDGFHFSEHGLCRQWCRIGNKLGLKVYIFTATSIREGRKALLGYIYENGGWQQRMLPAPDIVYDRCFTSDRKQESQKRKALSLLTATSPFIYLTRGFPGKWRVYETLRKSPEIAPYLPMTLQYQNLTQLNNWLNKHGGEAFLKPQNGTHGKQTLYVSLLQLGEQFGLNVLGRDNRNRMVRHLFPTRSVGLQWVGKFIGDRPFLLQPYLKLTNTKGEPYDIRALMQKDDKGIWQCTGLAARVGLKDTLTSNLHGGGSAYKASTFLIQELGESAARNVLALIQGLAMAIPRSLESHFGQLAELGIDFGVDRQGDVWVLEVNSKPGRTSFSKIGDPESAKKSVENPILYARHLLRKQTLNEGRKTFLGG